MGNRVSFCLAEQGRRVECVTLESSAPRLTPGVFISVLAVSRSPDA